MHEQLLALSISRRMLGAAIFKSNRLEHIEVRSVLADERRAVQTSEAFISWLVQMFEVKSAAIETPDTRNGDRRDILYKSVIAELRRHSVPIWEVSPTEMLQSFAEPPLGRRDQVRKIAASFWPVLKGGATAEAKLDAAAVGIYVQLRRLLQASINKQSK